jgi:hypothetical protein
VSRRPGRSTRLRVSVREDDDECHCQLTSASLPRWMVRTVWRGLLEFIGELPHSLEPGRSEPLVTVAGSSALVRTSSLARTFDTWGSTVLRARNSWAAISPLLARSPRAPPPLALAQRVPHQPVDCR